MGELKNELSWSRSRAQLFEECLRRYWFRYYGHWGGWAGNAHERTRAAYVLGKLQTRWMWAGDVVHRFVAETLELMRAGGKPEAEETAERAVARMRVEFDQSRKKKYWDNPKRYAGLLEHEYDVDLPDERWGDVADHVRACVRAFFESPFPERLAGLKDGCWFPIEQLSHFMMDGVKVYVKPDFAYRTENGVMIIDWKTGRSASNPDPIQLGCYTLFALEQKWISAPSQVMTIEYNLSSGRSHEETMSAERLEEVGEKMLESINRMRPYDGKPEADFPVAESPSTCRDCPFRKLCTEKPTP